jgi:uncharacterized protein YuzE
MKIQYFQDTDTLYIELNGNDIVETRDLDDVTLLDLDEHGRICGITLENASRRTDIEHVTMEGLAA